MKGRRWLKILSATAAALVVLLLVLSVSVFLARRPSAPPQRAPIEESGPGQIVYIHPCSESGRNLRLSAGSVWLMTADGGAQRDVTREAVHPYDYGDRSHVIHYESPAWSPDGRHLAFIRREYRQGLYSFRDERTLLVTDEQGELLRKLADNACSFTWAPDSATIAYATCVDRGWQELYPAPLSGDIWTVELSTGVTYLLPALQSPLAQARPLWSPDGRYIAFDTTDAQFTSTLYIVDMETDEQSPWKDKHITGFDWSPDGTRFVARVRISRAWMKEYLGVGNVKRRVFGQLVKDPDRQFSDPIWSPDGESIAFGYVRVEEEPLLPVGAELRPIGGGLAVVQANGWNERELLSFGAHPESWSPDGTRLLYTYVRTEEDESGDPVNRTWIGIVNVDGSAFRDLAEGCQPRWRPPAKSGG